MARENMTRQDWLDISEPRGDKSTNPLLNNLDYIDSLAKAKYPILPSKEEPSLMELIQSILPEKDTIDVPGILQSLLAAITLGGPLEGKGAKAIKEWMSPPPEEPWFNPQGSSYETGVFPQRIPYLPPKPMADDAINKLQDENTLKQYLEKTLYQPPPVY